MHIEEWLPSESLGEFVAALMTSCIDMSLKKERENAKLWKDNPLKGNKKTRWSYNPLSPVLNCASLFYTSNKSVRQFVLWLQVTKQLGTQVKYGLLLCAVT